MKTILFQGDSITDTGRDRDDDKNLGRGYPYLVQTKMSYECPEDFSFINRGISGNRIVDLYARIKKDIINVKPDYMSILIGVNDCWHELGREANGISAEKFEVLYTMLLDEIREALPELKLFLMTPYVTPGVCTDPYWEYFTTEVPKRAAVVKKLAEKYNLVLVDLQAEFDKAMEKAPATCWTQDGVHPTPAGHELIATAWRKAFAEIQ